MTTAPGIVPIPIKMVAAAFQGRRVPGGLHVPYEKTVTLGTVFCDEALASSAPAMERLSKVVLALGGRLYDPQVASR